MSGRSYNLLSQEPERKPEVHPFFRPRITVNKSLDHEWQVQ